MNKNNSSTNNASNPMHTFKSTTSSSSILPNTNSGGGGGYPSGHVAHKNYSTSFKLVPELIDSLRTEFDQIYHDFSLCLVQRDDYERRLRSQISELSTMQNTILQLEKSFSGAKTRYINEIQQLKQQLEAYQANDDKDTQKNKKRALLPSSISSNGDAEKRQRTRASSSSTSVDGDWFVMHNPDKPPQMVDVELLKTIHHQSVVCCVAFSPDGRYLATGSDSAAKLYNVETGTLFCTFPNNAQAGSSSDQGETSYTRSMCFSPDGKYLATGMENKVIRLWNVANQSLVHTFCGHQLEIYSVVFSADGQYILSGSGDRTAKLWKVESRDNANACILTFGTPSDTSPKEHDREKAANGPTDGVTSVAISPDGDVVATGSLDKSICLWDSHTGKMLRYLEGHSDSVYSVNFSPDGRHLVSGSLDRTFRVWDLSVLRKKTQLPSVKFSGHDDFVLSVAFTPDSAWVVSGSKDKRVLFWDLNAPADSQPSTSLQGHQNSIISMAISPDSNTLATASGDKTTRIWSYRTKSTNTTTTTTSKA